VSGIEIDLKENLRVISLHHHVVIIGGGFGGLYAAKELGNRQGIKATLIDKRNFHLFQPLLYQVATGGLSPGDIASPLRGITSGYKNIEVLCDEMTGIDPENRLIRMKSEQINYDFLILATGMQNYYFNHATWPEFAPGLKTIEDALEMRRRIFLAFEEAEKTTNIPVRDMLMRFVVIGGGPTGVELAGALGELALRTLKRDFRRINTGMSKIYLLEGGEKILPMYPDHLVDSAMLSLKKLGVHIHTGAKVISISDTRIKYEQHGQEHEINAGTILWAAGVRPTGLNKTFAEKTGAGTDKMGRIIVSGDCSVPGYPEIFVIGDAACFLDETGRALPGVSPVAMQQGKYVARTIIRRLQNKPIQPFSYRDKGSLAVIGRNAAIANFRLLRMHGFIAWLIWVFVHIGYLIEFDNKLIVMTQWAWNYVTRKKGARLITETARNTNS